MNKTDGYSLVFFVTFYGWILFLLGVIIGTGVSDIGKAAEVGFAFAVFSLLPLIVALWFLTQE